MKLLHRILRMRIFEKIIQGCNHLPLQLWDLLNRMRSIKRLQNNDFFGMVTQDKARMSADFRKENNIPTFHQNLKDQIFPFWAKHAIDRQFGGYIVHLDRAGSIYDASHKTSAMQARMIYAFSLAEELFPSSGYRALAEHGVAFLIKHFWDKRYDGWFLSVHRDGSSFENRKHLYSQTYVLIGLCQFYHLTGDKNVLEYIIKTYEVLENQAWDNKNTGYYQSCRENWEIEQNIKTACIHLDVIAAMLQMEMAIGGDIYQLKIAELAAILVDKICDKKSGVMLEHYSANWRYLPYSTRDQIQFGHNLKAAWVLMRAYAVLGNNTYLEKAKFLVDYSLRFGWDINLDGFYQDAFRSGGIVNEIKLWWPECEGLLALARIYKLTGEKKYLSAYIQLAQFIDNFFYDHKYGELYHSLKANGSQENASKGGDFKSAFHTVEAFNCSMNHLADLQLYNKP